MATDVRKHTVPAAGDAPSRSAILDLAKSIRDVIPVADTTARGQLITDLTTAGIGPSTSNPVFVFRADATVGREVEYTTDGSTWRVFQAGVRPNIASGTVVITPSAANTPTSGTISFPVGLFASAPNVVVGQAGATPGTAVTGCSVDNATITTSGATVYVTRVNTTPTRLFWIATDA